MPQAMLKDQSIVRKQLQELNRMDRGGVSLKKLQHQFTALEKRLQDSFHKRQARLRNKPAVSFPEELPITSKSREIICAIKENQVVIISGETGCGKSTQIPKMCIKAGLGIYGQIACTQPRRIAATTIAKRIAEEMGENLGRSVGYKIRFKDRTPHSAYIKILTDGMLLAETQADPLLYEYDTLIIDEAHERSLNIDFLLGIARSLLVSRPELKLIITSATLDTEKFSRAFNSAPVIEAGGKLYPVEVEYRSPGGGTEKAEDQDYVTEAVKAVHSLRLQKPPGDILIFMPTEQDILETCRKLEGRKYPAVTVLPLFARLPGTRQGRVYSVKGPKIVVATNVAETSLTIPGIKYVIDTGLARISHYLAGTRINSLPISPISQASADQRKGRCGRLKAGYCTRLYFEDDFSSRTRFTIPEILRSNLAEVILRMTAMQLCHPATFPFLDRPLPKHIKDGYDTLLELGALERKGRDYRLTSKGRLMARMPLDPRISRMLIEARNEGCLHEVAIIASALSTRDPRERPPEKESQADQMHAPFKDPDSDFITLLNIWNKYNSKWEKLTSQNKKRRFCKEHFLSFPRMREWTYIHEQIMMILKELRISVGSEKAKKKSKTFYAGIHRSILSGYLSNIAVNKQNKIYTAPKDREAMIFPGSTLFNKTPPWIVAAEMVFTSRLFARTVAKIDVKWLESLGKGLNKYSHSNPRWDKKRGEVVADEQVTLYGLEIVSGRRVSYRPINPKHAHRIFIRSALVEGQTQNPMKFIDHNRNLVKKLSIMENKLRRRDILVSEEVIEDFYSTRLEGISDIRSLERKIKLIGGDDFLKLTEKQIIRSLPGEEELAFFPDEIDIGNMRVKASYTFAPGEEKDGVTLKIPARRIAEVPEESLDWSIPGFFREIITALIKGLPKRYRKQLVPAAEKADIIANEIERSGGALPNALAEFVKKRFHANIPAPEWAQVDIPRHLKMRLALTDSEGKELKAGRDLEELVRTGREVSVSRDSGAWIKARKKWEQTGLKSWDFGALPEHIPVGVLADAYPGLEPAEEGVNVSLFHRQEDALNSHRLGVQALLLKKYAKDLDFAGGYLKLPGEHETQTLFFGGKTALEKGMYKNLKKEIFQKNLRSREDYLAYAETIGSALFEKGHILRETVLKILDAHRRTCAALVEAEKSSKTGKAVLALCKQIREDLDTLVPKNFLELYSLDRLKHLPRYLDAVQMRIERGKNNLEKDRQKTLNVEQFQRSLDRMQESISSETSMGKKASIEEFRWMIEEFRISLFAPELKTPFPISAKRLTQKLTALDKMI